ncbi:MAG: hypothetical protein MI867_04715 [Pseudomonadales bacterium]|nr:hypothetical protein [Pseudomonadales bacterium]
MSLLYYRDWAERHEPVATGRDLSAEAVNDSHAALSCPKCGKLMTKYRINGCQNNRLDLCASCDEAWLDGGEWELLKSLELSYLMPKVFTEEWQRKLRKEALETSREARLASRINAEDLDLAKQTRDWLKDHPNKADIIFYLNHE